MVQDYINTLEKDGIVVIENFLSDEQVSKMRDSFEVKLKRMRWNDMDGYEKTEKYRHFVFDILTLEQGFVDVAVDPRMKEISRHYLGENFACVEARGWRSMPVMKEFHGWHGDAWYDQTGMTKDSPIPRELKMAVYLNDVKSGAFEYMKGSHRKYHPCGVIDGEALDAIEHTGICTATGKAGTAVIFDTSGIHHQSIPVLEPRIAIFLNYRDPSIPIQQEDIDYYRYHPLVLNAAFLGGLSEDDQRVLGFGDKTNYIPNFERAPKFTKFQKTMSKAYDALMLGENIKERVAARVRKHI